MNGSNEVWHFILSALAVWRLTHLFAEEDGPGDLIVDSVSAWAGASSGP